MTRDKKKPTNDMGNLMKDIEYKLMQQNGQK